jgi:hypothetical protein
MQGCAARVHVMQPVTTGADSLVVTLGGSGGLARSTCGSGYA